MCCWSKENILTIIKASKPGDSNRLLCFLHYLFLILCRTLGRALITLCNVDQSALKERFKTREFWRVHFVWYFAESIRLRLSARVMRKSSPEKWWLSSAPKDSHVTPARSWACPVVNRERYWCHHRLGSCRATSCSRTTWVPVVSYHRALCGASCRSWRHPRVAQTRDGSHSCWWWRCRPGRRWSQIWRRRSSSWLSWRRTCESRREKESQSVWGVGMWLVASVHGRAAPAGAFLLPLLLLLSFSISLFSSFFLTCFLCVHFVLSVPLLHLPLFSHIHSISSSFTLTLFLFHYRSVTHQYIRIHAYTVVHINLQTTYSFM